MKYLRFVLAALLLAACSAHAPGLPPASSFDARTFDRASGPRYLREYTLPLGTYPSSIVSGPDGALWFTTYPYFTNHQAINLGVGRITLQGKQHYYLFENGLYDMVVGAQGRMWWTNPFWRPFSTGYVTTSGTFVQFTGDGGGDPEIITADAAGNPWYIRFGASHDVIGMNQNGRRVREFQIPWAVRTAWGTGNQLWLNAIATPHSLVGYIHGGGFHRVQIPGGNYIPGLLTPGPDGRMWFCQSAALAAVTSSLQVTLYPLPQNHECAGLVTGPDGNIWAADFQGSTLIRMTPSGSVTLYPTPTPNMIPAAICVGPDGNIWFTEIQHDTDVSKIGVLKP